MSKKICDGLDDFKKKDKKLKYECKKCGRQAPKEKNCCKPVKIV